MPTEPQPSPYRPDPAIAAIADWIGDRVEPAGFPEHTLRFRNDRWAAAVGLDGLDEGDWVRHFGRFDALPGNLEAPLALRYHGHQFRHYNPDLGDGRGFLFAQLRDGDTGDARLLDLGTKGSGQTPWSRTADGRLTLKGAVREVLATEMLEAQGVYTSKTLSVIETGEALVRGDEPSPARSAVLVRLSHGHIRIGSFQRLAALAEHEHLARLVAYCLAHYPGPLPPADAPDRDNPAVILLHQATERLADCVAGWMAAGFVHGVLNTDNMNITGESFDYGPWRWLPEWRADFTAAYFDQHGLYAFGRQPEAVFWNLQQLAIALRPLAESAPLVAALERFDPLYQQALTRRFLWRLGVKPHDPAADPEVVAAAEALMREYGGSPEAFLFAHRGGRGATGAFARALAGYAALPADHAYWSDAEPQTLLIEEVEAIWACIAEADDWSAFASKVAAIRRMGAAHGAAPQPAGHGGYSDEPAR